MRTLVTFLLGKVDLLLGSDGKLELLDFKTSERSSNPRLLEIYEGSTLVPTHTSWSDVAANTLKAFAALLDRLLPLKRTH